VFYSSFDGTLQVCGILTILLGPYPSVSENVLDPLMGVNSNALVPTYPFGWLLFPVTALYSLPSPPIPNSFRPRMRRLVFRTRSNPLVPLKLLRFSSYFRVPRSLSFILVAFQAYSLEPSLFISFRQNPWSRYEISTSPLPQIPFF